MLDLFYRFYFRFINKQFKKIKKMRTLKYCAGILLLVIIVFMSCFQLTSCKENTEDNLVCDLWYYSTRQWDFGLGISVEEDPVNGVYLVFQNDSVFDGFLDKMDHILLSEREKLVQTFYEQGFISRKKWEEKNPDSEHHPSPSFSLLVNPDGLIKIGDTLYQDVFERQLFSVDKNGEKILIRERNINISKSLKRESKTVSKDKEGYNAGPSGLPTMLLIATLVYDVRIIRDDIVEINAYSYISEVDKYSWRKANSTFFIKYTYDYQNEDGVHRIVENATSEAYGTSCSEILAKSWRITDIEKFTVRVTSTYEESNTRKNLTIPLTLTATYD